jgi:hypothetical protein
VNFLRLSVVEPYTDLAAHSQAVERFLERMLNKKAQGWIYRPGTLRFLPGNGNNYRIEADFDKP